MISGKTHLVLQALASFEGPPGLFPSHEAIAARAGCSTRTVIRSLEKAYLLGLVERTRRRVKRQGRMVSGSNLYRLVLKPLEQAKVAARHYSLIGTIRSHGVSRAAWWFFREGSNGTARGHLLSGFHGRSVMRAPERRAEAVCRTRGL